MSFDSIFLLGRPKRWLSVRRLLLAIVVGTTGCAGSSTTASNNSASPPPAGPSAPPAPTPDTVAPSVPSSLAAIVVSSTQLQVSWGASTDNVGVSGYRLFRDGAQIATVATTSYLDGSLAPATSYAYRVAAVDAAGNVSAQSSVASATTSALGGTGTVYQGNPGNYLGLLRNLKAGDTLVLEPGSYDDLSDVPGLPIFGLNGTASRPITITGPETGPRAVILGRSTHNTVRLDNASYVTIRNIEIDGRNLGGDGINSQGVSHHITIENVLIHGVGSNQQVVGISTNSAATWNWVIRHNEIVGAGTGMYLGHPNGINPFVAGVIEHNVIRDTIGYNIEIKHQVSRPSIAGMPTVKSSTFIRHNVFGKSSNSSSGSNARPNLLVGHFPPSGVGADDVYEIYGNFFYQNPSEALFQGEGNIAFHHNLLVNAFGSAINIQPHNDIPKMIRIFHNTVVATGSGVRVTGGDPAFQQLVIGNAVFASNPTQGGSQQQNITDSYANAPNFLNNPTGSLGSLDLFPQVSVLRGSSVDTSSIDSFVDWNVDFNGAPQDETFRGAYSGEGANSGWLPQLSFKP